MYQAEISKALAAVGWDDSYRHRTVNTLSGGEKTRLGLARLLLSHPDILLLDEPTNYMDIDGMEWLEQFLHSFSGAVVVVSHDRHFLDKVASEIVEIEKGKSVHYSGNYSEYVRQKQVRLESQAETYKQQQRRIQQLEQMIARHMAWFHKAHKAAGTNDFLRGKSKKHIAVVKSKRKQLERLKEQAVEKPKEPPRLKINFGEEVVPGSELIVARGLRKAYGERVLFDDVNLAIPAGGKLGLIGPNGSGKSTFIRLLLGEEVPTAGEIWLGKSTVPAYFDQELGDLDLNRSAVDELTHSTGLTLNEARFLLACYQIYAEKATKPMRQLSPGERVRVSLTKMLVCGANFLILDEPTNHLDIPSRESMEQALCEFPGSVLLVSHDRYFMDEVVDGILSIENGTICYYPGSYSEFQQYKEHQEQLARSRNPALYDQLKQEIFKTEMQAAYLSTQLQETEHDEEQRKLLERQVRELCGRLSELRRQFRELQPE